MLTNVLYQVNMFGDFSKIEPNPDILIRLLNEFKPFQLMPGTLQEINPMVSLNPINRLSFTSVDKSLVIEFGTERLSIIKNATSEKGIEQSLENFLGNEIKKIVKTVDGFEIKSSRISLITNKVNLDVDEEKFSEIYAKLASPIEFYKEKHPFEWNIKNVARDNSGEELTNIILDISRSIGKFANSTKEFESINILTDINTIYQNNIERFDSTSIEVFLKYALEKEKELQNQVEMMIFE